MTTATPDLPASTIPEGRYARRIDLLDTVAHDLVHVMSTMLVDGKPLPAGTVEPDVAIECSRTDATRVSLSVHAGSLRVEPLAGDKYRVFLGEHEFLTPPDGVDQDRLRFTPEDEFVALTVYVTEVRIGPPPAG